jgi:hypothetical protein
LHTLVVEGVYEDKEKDVADGIRWVLKDRVKDDE